MSNALTPGPWHVGEGSAGGTIYDSWGWRVASAVVGHRYYDVDAMHANARLIAAAPDLLALAEMILEFATVETPQRLIDEANRILQSIR